MTSETLHGSECEINGSVDSALTAVTDLRQLSALHQQIRKQRKFSHNMTE